ncbi:hypothetical protein FAUST_7673 [Fusarium austroamericanum]|uniref:Uncharacterized protein n=1 Tax=Fusarium austroamericanum TaxID=282268 RepID=A0AAN5Z632_FUSAU|nr:hypothetical protein FAUST_7673 [Fusarium austroamericanum]
MSPSGTQSGPKTTSKKTTKLLSTLKNVVRVTFYKRSEDKKEDTIEERLCRYEERSMQAGPPRQVERPRYEERPKYEHQPWSYKQPESPDLRPTLEEYDEADLAYACHGVVDDSPSVESPRPKHPGKHGILDDVEAVAPEDYDKYDQTGWGYVKLAGLDDFVSVESPTPCPAGNPSMAKATAQERYVEDDWIKAYFDKEDSTD